MNQRKKNVLSSETRTSYKLLSCPLPSCLEEPLLLTLGPTFNVVRGLQVRIL